MRFYSALLIAPVLIACGGPPAGDPAEIAVEETSSLATALRRDDVSITGITVDPLNGQRYAVDPAIGVVELLESGSKVVFHAENMRDPNSFGSMAVTDIAALGNGKFGMTVRNDGYLLDLEAGTFARHFCYVPGFIGDEFGDAVYQLTRSLTYEPNSNLMFAQPQTIQVSDDAPILNQIGRFETSGGEGYGWLDLDDLDFSAGGIAMRSADEMLLGADSELHVYDMTTNEFTKVYDLRDFGIEQIEAMAYDWDAERLLVVDGATDQLVEVSLAK